MSEIPDALLNKLIEFGKVAELSDLGLYVSAHEQSIYGHIMRLRPEAWYLVADSINIDNLVALIKGLTIAEKSFREWRAGSASPVIWLFRKLSNLDSNLADVIADWVLVHTSNLYLPFGKNNFGASSLDEYHRLENIVADQKQARQKAELHRQEMARYRKAQEATHNLFGAVKRSDIKAIQALIAKGADIKAKDKAGVSLSEYARLQGNEEILYILDGTKVEIKNDYFFLLTNLLANIDSILNRLNETQLGRYNYLQRQLREVDIVKDRDYQVAFNGYYRMRQRSKEWYSFFFALLEQEKNNLAVAFENILGEVYQKTNRIEPSFSSKLIATIRPEKPVYDKYVRENMMLIIPQQHEPKDTRVRKFIMVYSILEEQMSRITQTDTFRELKHRFDKRFPTYSHFTETKKLDLLLWQYRENG